MVEIALTLLVVGNSEHSPLLTEPRDLAHAIAGLTVAIPERRIGARKAEQNILHPLERQIVGAYFEHHDHYIGVMKEIEVAAMHRELMDESVREGQPSMGDVAAPIDADAGFPEVPAFLPGRRA